MTIKYQLTISFILIMFVSFVGCSKTKQSNLNEQSFEKQAYTQEPEYDDELIEVDVTKEYPKMDIHLEDIANVEFTPLETNDNFICEGRTAAIIDSFILFANKQDGNIFVFDATGKALKRFNHKGRSGKEYAGISQALWDENNKELYINDMWTKRILVYDLDGNYKRHFNHTSSHQYMNIANYNDSCLICQDAGGIFEIMPGDKIKKTFIIISKQTGKTLQEIDIPFQEKLTLSVGGNVPGINQLFQFGKKAIVIELSSDTIYSISENDKLSPVIVRTPPIRTMNLPVFLTVQLVTSRYIFMSSIKKEFDEKTQKGFPSVLLVYDQKDKKIYEYTLFYQDTKISFTSTFPRIRPLCTTINQDTYVGELPAYLLKKKENDNELNGSLQELASRVNEEDNPVVMKITFKQ